jgi:hypothetical protein
MMGGYSYKKITECETEAKCRKCSTVQILAKEECPEEKKVEEIEVSYELIAIKGSQVEFDGMILENPQNKNQFLARLRWSGISKIKFCETAEECKKWIESIAKFNPYTLQTSSKFWRGSNTETLSKKRRENILELIDWQNQKTIHPFKLFQEDRKPWKYIGRMVTMLGYKSGKTFIVKKQIDEAGIGENVVIDYLLRNPVTKDFLNSPVGTIKAFEH